MGQCPWSIGDQRRLLDSRTAWQIEKELYKDNHIEIGTIATGQRTDYTGTAKKGPLGLVTASILAGVPHILTGPQGWPQFTRLNQRIPIHRMPNTGDPWMYKDRNDCHPNCSDGTQLSGPGLRKAPV